MENGQSILNLLHSKQIIKILHSSDVTSALSKVERAKNRTS